MEKYRSSGLLWMFSVIIFGQILHAVFGDLPLRSRSFQGKILPQLTLNNDMTDAITLITNTANMADDLPPKRRLKTKKLLKRLGEFFDPEWMSIEKPAVADNQIIRTSNATSKDLQKELNNVNFTMVHPNGSVISMEQSVLEAVQNWLVGRASCPIHYVWVDQGERWWPRWLKTGVCVDDMPCSWPPGMHCVPAENRVIRLLRWVCRSKRFSAKNWKKRFRLKGNKNGLSHNEDSDLQKQKTKRESGAHDHSQADDFVKLLQSRSRFQLKKGKKKCKWHRVRYPVTSECFCTC